MNEGLAHGLIRFMPYGLRDKGVAEAMDRGVYQVAKLPTRGYPDRVAVNLRFPDAAIRPVPGRAYDDATTQDSCEAAMARPRKSRAPWLGHSPIEAHRSWFYQRRSQPQPL